MHAHNITACLVSPQKKTIAESLQTYGYVWRSLALFLLGRNSRRCAFGSVFEGCTVSSQSPNNPCPLPSGESARVSCPGSSVSKFVTSEMRVVPLAPVHVVFRPTWPSASVGCASAMGSLSGGPNHRHLSHACKSKSTLHHSQPGAMFVCKRYLAKWIRPEWTRRSKTPNKNAHNIKYLTNQTSERGERVGANSIYFFFEKILDILGIFL